MSQKASALTFPVLSTDEVLMHRRRFDLVLTGIESFKELAQLDLSLVGLNLYVELSGRAAWLE